MHDLRHGRISLLHLRGVPWARIGEFVGQRAKRSFCMSTIAPETSWPLIVR